MLLGPFLGMGVQSSLTFLRQDGAKMVPGRVDTKPAEAIP